MSKLAILNLIHTTADHTFFHEDGLNDFRDLVLDGEIEIGFTYHTEFAS